VNPEAPPTVAVSEAALHDLVRRSSEPTIASAAPPASGLRALRRCGGGDRPRSLQHRAER
jgi:hypothetical protein